MINKKSTKEQENNLLIEEKKLQDKISDIRKNIKDKRIVYVHAIMAGLYEDLEKILAN